MDGHLDRRLTGFLSARLVPVEVSAFDPILKLLKLLLSRIECWLLSVIPLVYRYLEMLCHFRGGCGNLNSRDKWIFRVTAA